jgi:hypothetical protein
VAPPPRSWRRRAFAIAAVTYLVAGLLAQRELVRAGAGDHFYYQGMLGQDCLLHAWSIAWDQHALATAPCSLPDANIFFPERATLLYSDHLVGLALVSAPLRLVTDNPLLVHNVLTIAAPIVDALALFALALDLTYSPVAALVGGFAFGFAPVRLGADACQIQMSAAWWMPLVLLFALRAVRGDGRRWGALAGVCLLGQGLTSIYQTAYFAPFLALAHAVWLRRHPPGGSRGGWSALLAGEAMAALLLLPLALAYRDVQAHLGTARSPFLNAILSLHPHTLPTYVPWITLVVLAALVVRRPDRLPGRLRAERGLFLAITAGAFVLALGPTIDLPNGMGTLPGPYRLLVALPGFTALRVPARMLHVALVGASVLAAGGTVVLRDALRRWAPAVPIAIVVALGLEGPPPALQPTPFRVGPPNPVIAWLARRPQRLRIVDLPIDPFELDTAQRQLESSAHWTPMLNGNTGVLPPVYPYMKQRLQAFPARDVVTDLVALGITHAVVRIDRLAPETQALVTAAESERRLLKRRWASGTTVVYSLRRALRPRPAPPAGLPLARVAWRASASVATDLAMRAIDGDPTSAWRSWGDLEADVTSLAYRPRPILARWNAFLETVPATLTIDLGAPALVADVQLTLGGSDPMVLPELRLEGSLDGLAWAPLPLAPSPDVRALVGRAADLPLATTLPAPRDLRYLRLAVGAFDVRVRDVIAFGG